MREDRFAGSGPSYGGGGRGGGGGYPPRGGFSGRGAYGGGRGGYSAGYGRGGPSGYSAGGGGYEGGAVIAPNPFTDYATSGGDPSEIIHVRNVSGRPAEVTLFVGMPRY